MPKSISYHNECPTLLQSPFRALCRMFAEWNAARSTQAAARKQARTVGQLDAYLRHDIGESDCRPKAKTFKFIQREQAAQLEAMRQRLL